MTWEPEQVQENAITHVQARPREPDRPDERSRWQRFKEFIWPRLRKGAGLSQAYLEAQADQAKNVAKKLAEQAAEIHERTGGQKLQNVRVFSSIIDDIYKDDALAPEAKLLKLAKLIESDPHLGAQLEKFLGLRDRLHLTKGLNIEPLGEQAALPPQPAQESDTDGEHKTTPDQSSALPPRDDERRQAFELSLAENLARDVIAGLRSREQLFDYPVAILEDLSVRAVNVLVDAQILTLGELVKYTESDLLGMQHFGETTVDELQSKLEKFGLSLGMEITSGAP